MEGTPMARPEDAAVELLSDQGVTAPPVPVEELATSLGCNVSYQPFQESDISGLLFRDGERIIVGVNASQSKRRQRFTVAHEIAHLVLHPGRPMILEKLVRVNLRDGLSSQATSREEIEANQFAAALLMPREFVFAQVHKLAQSKHQVTDEEVIQSLADIFDVSVQAMRYRLINLGLLPPED
jgi:Zn-dependent peptidase ImmA (M78 family)